jgi:regulator of extracellular matrix RemA (YlzA/DUF370 family)
MLKSEKLIHPTFGRRVRTVLLVDKGSQSFITGPLSKVVDDRKELDI